MKIAHDNEVCIVIGGSGDLVGSEDEPEGSFPAPLSAILIMRYFIIYQIVANFCLLLTTLFFVEFR